MSKNLAEDMLQISLRNSLLEFYSNEKAKIYYQKILEKIKKAAESCERLIYFEFGRMHKDESSSSRLADVYKMYKLLSSKANEDGFYIEFIDGLDYKNEFFYRLKISW